MGAIQNVLALKGNEIRQLATKNAKVITYPLWKLKINVLALKEEMGFNDDEIKQMILTRPKLLMKGKKILLKQLVEYLLLYLFDYNELSTTNAWIVFSFFLNYYIYNNSIFVIRVTKYLQSCYKN